MAFTQTVLAWGAINYQSGYEAAGQRQYIIENLKWGADYLMGAHVSSNELISQVGISWIPVSTLRKTPYKRYL